MSHYRDLNRELVEQIQNMKLQLKLYFNEIINLKREMMENHESQVLFKNKILNSAVKNFKKLIEDIEPESVIIKNLNQHERQSWITSTQNTEESSRSSCDGRRSSQLREELQRSNNIIHSRRSLCSTSPVRHSTEITQEEDPEEVETVQQKWSTDIIEEDIEEDENEDEEEEDVPVVQQKRNTDNTEQDIEVDEEIPTSQVQQHNSDVDTTDVISSFISLGDATDTLIETIDEQLQNNLDEVIEDNASSLTPLGDITNTLIDSIAETGNNSNNKFKYSNTKSAQKRKCARSTKRRTQNHMNMESVESMDSSSPTVGRCLAPTDRGATRRKNISIRMAEIIAREVSISSSSFAVCDVTLQNFNVNVASSTPNSRHNSTYKPKENTPPSASTSQLINKSTTRPSRKCKPTVLSEPRLGTKLRNESSEVLRKRSKSRNK